MSDIQTFVLQPDPHPARRNAVAAVYAAPEGHVVVIRDATRSLEQNAASWPLLTQWAKQKEWPVNGKMTRLTAEEWKTILTAAFRNETGRIAQGLDGGMVLLGARTRDFTKKEFSDWLEFLYAASAQHGVKVQRVEEIDAQVRARPKAFFENLSIPP